jgi:hypothetical protein
MISFVETMEVTDTLRFCWLPEVRRVADMAVPMTVDEMTYEQTIKRPSGMSHQASTASVFCPLLSTNEENKKQVIIDYSFVLL